MARHWLFLTFFLLLGSPALAGEGNPDSSSDLGTRLISLYRDNISAVDGDRCPSYPTCASYSMLAIKKHGLFMGWLMTVDRLIHEGSEETAVSPLVYKDGRQRIFDPVGANDFWWFKDENRATN